MRCPITGEKCDKNKSFDIDGEMICDDCFKKYDDYILSILSIENNKCPSCGISLSDLMKKTRLGCASCYESFKDISYVISSVQNGESDIKHIGKVPNNFLKEKSRSITFDQIKEEIKMRMLAAVSKEDYIIAAKMKSKIEELDLLELKKEQADYADQLAQFVMSFWTNLE